MAIQTDFAYAILDGVFRYTNTWPLGIQLVESGVVELDVLVTSTFVLADAEQTLTAGREPGQMKVILYAGR
ncbi:MULTISPECIES: hypothetical protein [unclassified Cryobacterium]|uniref:hypothetical protein n=1 Tax=unclassified Cryobacterium TaxID=2649013 RepID=UPI001E337A95|nr:MULTISPECIES: hypothetical protein [unclassified Cryobacterium]